MVMLLLNQENCFQYLGGDTHMEKGALPDSDVRYGNHSEEITHNPDSDHKRTVESKTNPSVRDFLRLAFAVVGNPDSSAFCVDFARYLSNVLR